MKPSSRAIEEGDVHTATSVMRVHVLAIEKRLREPILESAK